MQEGVHALHKMVVEQLRDAIMLRRVMGSEATFSALLFEVLGELTAGVLPTAVRAQMLDAHTMLSVSPRCEVLVGIQSLVLGVQGGQTGVTGGVIGECNVISPFPHALYWCRTPQVTMHLVSKGLGQQCL